MSRIFNRSNFWFVFRIGLFVVLSIIALRALVLASSMVNLLMSVGVPITGPPTVVTNAATNITSSSATLNGTANPNGASGTVAYYNYGLTSSYTNSSSFLDVAQGSSAVSIPIGITGLSSGQTYHFQACAKNTIGTGCGGDLTFSASPPGSLTRLATVDTSSYMTEVHMTAVDTSGNIYMCGKNVSNRPEVIKIDYTSFTVTQTFTSAVGNQDSCHDIVYNSIQNFIQIGIWVSSGTLTPSFYTLSTASLSVLNSVNDNITRSCPDSGANCQTAFGASGVYSLYGTYHVLRNASLGSPPSDYTYTNTTTPVSPHFDSVTNSLYDFESSNGDVEKYASDLSGCQGAFSGCGRTILGIGSSNANIIPKSVYNSNSGLLYFLVHYVSGGCNNSANSCVVKINLSTFTKSGSGVQLGYDSLGFDIDLTKGYYYTVDQTATPPTLHSNLITTDASSGQTITLTGTEVCSGNGFNCIVTDQTNHLLYAGVGIAGGSELIKFQLN